MNNEFWKIVWENQNCKILKNRNGFYVVDSELRVLELDGCRLGPYESLAVALKHIEGTIFGD